MHLTLKFISVYYLISYLFQLLTFRFQSIRFLVQPLTLNLIAAESPQPPLAKCCGHGEDLARKAGTNVNSSRTLLY